MSMSMSMELESPGETTMVVLKLHIEIEEEVFLEGRTDVYGGAHLVSTMREGCRTANPVGDGEYSGYSLLLIWLRPANERGPG